MIHQLILNSLLACQSKRAPEVASPPENSTSAITLVEKLSEPKAPDPYTNLYTSPVYLFNIIPRVEMSDDQFCKAICHNILMRGAQFVSNIDNCQLELLSGWEEEYNQMLSLEDPSKELQKKIGNIECTAEIDHYMKGRAGLSPTKSTDTQDNLGGYFARAAQEEMTAVFAFQEMKENLRSFGAPQQLLDDCEKAIIDEQRHTMMMTALAKRHGCKSALIKLPEQKLVSLFTLAKHNAIAGCIEETWSALVAEYQAKHTKHYAKLFEIIAKDEIFHAQLSWDIHQWLMAKLSEKEQQEIQELIAVHLSKMPKHRFKFLKLGDIPPYKHQELWEHFRSQLDEQFNQLAA